MAISRTTVYGPASCGGAFLVEGKVTFDAAGEAVKIGKHVLGCTISHDDADGVTELAGSSTVNSSDGTSTLAAGQVFFSHAGSGDETFNYSALVIM